MGLPVDVVRSPKRRKTVQAREIDGRLRVMIPAWMSRADEAYWVAEMQRRIGGRPNAIDDTGLADRAAGLAARYRLPAPKTISWSERQGRRWGSCTPASGTIRISARLSKAPAWVLDFVIVHELAHLVVASHDDRFLALVDRYPRAQRAQGFLEGWGMLGDDDDAEQSVLGIDHLRVPVPTGRDADVVDFYAGLLGLRLTRGAASGLWFGDNGFRLVATPTTPHQPQRLALAVRGLPDLIARLTAAGQRVRARGIDHATVEDPFGNRIDLVDRTGVASLDEEVRTGLRRPRRRTDAQEESAVALS